MTWMTANRQRVREIQDSLIAVARMAEKANAGAHVLELLTQPYREMLDDLYQRDQPLAKLADESDLLLHIMGPSASGPVPKISVVTSVMTRTRDEVTKLAKLHGGIISTRVPSSLDMGLVGIAGGSLYIGFSAIDAGGDSTFTDLAVDSITRMSALVSSDASLESIDASFPDPAERDVAIAAIHHLAPSGQLGIKEIDVLGRRVSAPASWTTDTRRSARAIMTRPAKRDRTKQTFIGTVRELDLDAKRFDLRAIDGQQFEVRCAHELEDDEAKALMDQRVRVSGGAELGPKGAVRLLWIDEIELLA